VPVAVVGAGLAGLTCAYRLRQAGIAATVYEASTRTGGRCWTRRGAFDEGQVAERGGELIDQSHTAIRHLAQQLGLALDNVLAAEPNGTEARFRFFGQSYSPTQAARDLQAHVWQALKRDYVEASYPTLYTESTAHGRTLDAMSIAQWIDARVPGGRGSPLGKLLEIAYVIEYGAEAGEQSALNLVYLLGQRGQGQLRLFGASNEKYKVRGGNDLIVQGLADALRGQIETGAALTAIARTADGRYTLSFRNRPSVTAQRVVLALPFSVLRERVDIAAAGFSTLKRTAIRELGMGANGKLALQFRTRHWHSLGCNGDTIADTGYQDTWEVTRAQPGRAGILVNYTGGDVARRQSGGLPARLATQFLGQVAPVLPGLGDAYNGKATYDDWLRHEWTLGSYAYWKVGQYTRFAGVEGEPSGACHFAGEHTSVDFQGYLNGAVESGERAAREVLAALGRVPKA
jgi:monoamine oxidase